MFPSLKSDAEHGVCRGWFDPGNMVIPFPKSDTVPVANDGKAPRVSTEKYRQSEVLQNEHSSKSHRPVLIPLVLCTVLYKMVLTLNLLMKS